MPKITQIINAQILIAALIFSSSSLSAPVNIVISTPKVGNIDLLTNSSSTLNLNYGGKLIGNVTMDNAGQVITFNGGALEGEIDGVGDVIINYHTLLNGNIGERSAIKTLTIDDGFNLDLSTNNNSISASTKLEVGIGSSLIVGSGSISSSIRGSSNAIDGAGSVIFTANNDLLKSLGTSTTTLNLVELSSGATLGTNRQSINVNSISINNNATLNYGNGALIGDIDGKTSGVGNFIFNNSKTVDFNIGQTNKLAAINVKNGANITLRNGDIAADIINIGEGSNGRIKSGGANIDATSINLFTGSTLDIDASSSIIGNINGDANGNGTIKFSGDSSQINWTRSIGGTHQLEEIIISDETTLNIGVGAILNADSIIIGESGNLGIEGKIIQDAGILGFNENSTIRLKEGATFDFNGGTINGFVRGTSDDKGVFNVNADYVNNYGIGEDKSLSSLNIAAGATLTANANIYASNIIVEGILDLGNSDKTISGNLATSGNYAIIDLGNSNHNVTGDFTANNGDILRVNALNSAEIGSIIAGGVANVLSGVAAEISFNSDDGYVSDNTEFTIVSGVSGGLVNQVINDDIDVNNLGSNNSGLLTFSTKTQGSDLILVIDRNGAETFTNNESISAIYRGIDKAGASATGELRDLQKLIDNASTSNATRNSALESIIPQGNQDLNDNIINLANLSSGVVESRLNNILFNPSNSKTSFDNFFNNKNLSSGNFSRNSFSKNYGDSTQEKILDAARMQFDDEIFDKQSIWMQIFGSSADQKITSNSSGYDYYSKGIAIGVDQEILRNLRIGVSSSFSLSNVKSKSSSLKETDISSYQFNLYGGYNFEPYFISAILGVALNSFDSKRSMEDLGTTAKASYGGQTYIAKVESGMKKSLSSSLKIIPKIGLTALRNQVKTYSETGAGTLNLKISNKHHEFLEARIGADIIYDDLEISKTIIRPKAKVSYGYDLLGNDQHSSSSFEGQNGNFETISSNEDKSSFRYGVGIEFAKEDILISINYDIEKKSGYQSDAASLYLRYDF